jgi:hypothetical protein
VTLILELRPEVEAAVRSEAAARGVRVEDAAVEVLSEWAAQHQPNALQGGSAGLEALIALAQKMPRHREAAGLGPLPDNAVELDYEDREQSLL